MTEPTGTLKLRHAATDRATIVVVPRRRLFAIDGVGGPTAADFRFASDALRAVSEALRRRLRAAGAHDPGKPPIEVAWWTHPELPADAMADAFADRSSWHWQQIVEIPGRASDEDSAAAIDEVRRGAGREVALVRTIEIVEGRSAQILEAHIGAESEAVSIRRLAAEIEAAGLRPHGHLHQIFVTDPDVSARGQAEVDPADPDRGLTPSGSRRVRRRRPGTVPTGRRPTRGPARRPETMARPRCGENEAAPASPQRRERDEPPASPRLRSSTALQVTTRTATVMAVVATPMPDEHAADQRPAAPAGRPRAWRRPWPTGRPRTGSRSRPPCPAPPSRTRCRTGTGTSRRSPAGR